MTAQPYVFVDFGAVRIQSYLSRTPELRGRRAASDALARATSPEAVGRRIGTLAKINEDAGDADGVVSLVFAPAEGEDPEVRVRQLQDRVFAHLRKALPGAEFQSAWGTGASYLSAYAREIKPRFDAGEVRYDLPPTAEFPLARPCELCHTDPAIGEEPITGETKLLCPDCSMRNVARRSSAADDRSPEGQLRSSLPVTHTAPEDFTALARLSGPAKGGNHLATVFIDGNALGQFFTALASDSSVSARAKARVSRAVSDATREALTTATLLLPLTDRLDQVCVVPHVVGGDDVLVSVPADQAWHFVLGFLDEFGALVRNGVAEVLGDERPVPTITASAGVVFAHASHPFNLVVESAGRRLKEAKNAVRGQAASVQWLDITADGTEAPRHQPLLLSDLRRNGKPTEAAAALSRLAGVPASHRSTLAEAMRQGDWVTAATIAQRVGRHMDAVRPFLPPLDRPAGSPDGTPGDGPPTGIGLGTALGLARWWPCA
ncbi:hypothetical protein [Streptomyces sp. AC558_RSS880]|uniref:Cas10/Cmr2 second palm domain-containing protein n=1 Tax=Streptomyces sp. AC558_RSS880 TaxID=2823687 RepID=UPI001C231463|nr:hypothetical protein [Streptomyces sp. AC558_RSS880]